MTLQRTTSRLQTVLAGLALLAAPLACSKGDDGGTPPATGKGGAPGSGGRGAGGSSAGTGGSTPGTGGSTGQTGTGGSSAGTGGSTPAPGSGGSGPGTDAGGGDDAGTGTTPERGEVGAPGFPGWKFTKSIKMDTSAAGANVSGAVTNFPVAVVLNATNFDFEQAKPLGEDVRFGNAMGTPLPYAIESWDKAAKTAALWVRVPMVAGNDANQSINIYWGNPAAGDAGDSKAVFPTTDGYLGVWHLDEDGAATAGAFKDATPGAAHGTGVNLPPGARVPAVVGAGTKMLNAQRQWIKVEDAQKKFRPAQMTVSIWGWADGFPAKWGSGGSPGYQTIFSSGEGWTIQRETGGRFETCFQGGVCAIGRSANTKEWVHYVLVRTGGSHVFYMNGTRAAGSGAGDRMDAKDLGIGQQTQYLDPVRHANEQRSWEGIVDEARVITGAKDANWVKLDYESQKPGSKFLVFGQTQMRP